MKWRIVLGLAILHARARAIPNSTQKSHEWCEVARKLGIAPVMHGARI